MRAIACQKLFVAMARDTKSVSNNLNRVIKNEYLSVYSAKDRGFVVISHDDIFPAVIGFSDTQIDTTNLADGFSWWLQEATYSMQQRLKGNNWYTASEITNSIEPFITTTWDQLNPYNQKCPKVGTDRCPTGCVATAASQIMNYFKYPLKAQGRSKYYNNGLERNAVINSTYDWSHMKNTYREGESAQTPESKAVSTLMFDAGVASGMEYTPSYSAATLTDCAKGMTNIFQYDSLSLRNFVREYCSDLEWRNNIIDELSNMRPILYAGFSESGQDGHAFVFDGIDTEGRVHVNWGWGGECDGYYDMFLLQPRSEGIQQGDFRFYAQMLLGFNPTNTPTEDSVEHSTWFTDSIYRFFIDKTDSLVLNARCIFNGSYRCFRGKVMVRMDNINGNEDDSWDIILYDTEEEEASPIETFYGFVFNEEDENLMGNETIIGLRNDSIKDGTYIVSLVTQALYESEPEPIRYYEGVTWQYTLVKGADGSLSIHENVPTAILPLRRKKNYDTKHIFNMQGIPINETSLKRGIYIINGKKQLNRR